MSDFVTNLDVLSDAGAKLLWAIGYRLLMPLRKRQQSIELNYAVVDNAFDEPMDNVTGVTFRAQESSFMVGYIAAAVTKSGKVGFIGGITNAVIQQFQYGYMAGLPTAPKKLGKDCRGLITVCRELFRRQHKGKAIANKMFSDGCDVIYHMRQEIPDRA